MMLALMVGQTYLGQGLEGAARVVAVQSNLRVNESLLRTKLLLIFTTLLMVFNFYIETLYTALDGGAPTVTLWAYTVQVPDKLHFLRSLVTMPFHHFFFSTAEHFPPTGAHMRSCLGNQSLGILERSPRKRRQCCERMDDILCFFAIMRMVVWRFSLTETPRMIRRQQIIKDSRWHIWGSRRTVLSRPCIHTHIYIYTHICVC